MKKRLVLVKPPEVSNFNFGTFTLAVLAGAVRDAADVVLIDATELAVDKAVQKVLAENPDIIGVTVMSHESSISARDFIQSLKIGIKESCTSPIIIAGGHGASMFPEPLLEAGASAVVFGEGEITLLQIIEQGIIPGAKGICCESKEGIVRGKPQPMVFPLDRLNTPARDLITNPGTVFLMETSRGCPHSCLFCETTRFYGRQWRPFSPSRVAEEVRELIEKYSAWIIHFADDNFAADPQRVLSICEELQKGPLPAVILASARADDLFSNPGLLEAMSSAHIRRVTVGVESLDPFTARKAGKQVPLHVYREVFKKMRTCDIFSVASFIVGLPGEIPEARAKSVSFALEAAPDSAHFLPFLPLPGTPYAKGYPSCKADPKDILDSAAYNATFRMHNSTISRLSEAVAAGGIRGLFAEKVLAGMV